MNKIILSILVLFIFGNCSSSSTTATSSTDPTSTTNTSDEGDSSSEGSGFGEDDEGSIPTSTEEADEAKTEANLAEFITLTSPVSDTHPALASAFGPRLKASDNFRYDFHRGVDIPGEVGDPIFSIADGKLYKAYPEGSSSYPNGGNVVVIEYQLSAPISFQGQSISQFYAVYMHLDSFGDAANNYLDTGEKDTVTRGEQIATMGHTGDTTFTHLHFEIRLQTPCSLEYQTEHPTSSCAGYGFDPHVNPVPYFFSDVVGTYELAVSSSSSTQLTYVATADPDRLDVDNLTINIYDPSNLTTPLSTEIVDYNSRTGFDATSTEMLDEPDLGDILISPSSLNAETGSYEMTFVYDIPSSVYEGRSEITVVAELKTVSEVVDTLTTELNQ